MGECGNKVLPILRKEDKNIHSGDEMTNEVVTCSFCGEAEEIGKVCIGFGIEKPISQSHYFCCEEHRSEFIVSETAKERGIGYEMRKYINKGRTVKYNTELSENDMIAMKSGEIITCLDDDESELMRIQMNPFGEVKEY
jgi:hypothetical protein